MRTKINIKLVFKIYFLIMFIMKKTIIIGSAVALLWILFIGSTFASGWYGRNSAGTSTYTPGTNSWSSTFVDADNDGVCDNYKNRPMDWTWRGQWKGMGRHR